MFMLRLAISVLIVSASFAEAITPGGSYSLFNGSSGTIIVQVRTVARPNQRPYQMSRGYGDGGSGDHSKLVGLSVTLPDGKKIVLDEKALDERSAHAARSLFGGHGVWWIDDSGIRLLSSREGNIRINRFLTGKHD